MRSYVSSSSPTVSQPAYHVLQAPEVLMGGKCSTKVDVYSLGVILHELITGEAPKRGRMRPLK